MIDFVSMYIESNTPIGTDPAIQLEADVMNLNFSLQQSSSLQQHSKI